MSETDVQLPPRSVLRSMPDVRLAIRVLASITPTMLATWLSSIFDQAAPPLVEIRYRLRGVVSCSTPKMVCAPAADQSTAPKSQLRPQPDSAQPCQALPSGV